MISVKEGACKRVILSDGEGGAGATFEVEGEMTGSEPRGVGRRGVLAGFGAGAGLAGLAGIRPAGAATLLPEPETAHDFDVVVIGAGMAGCAAALEAAETGARVVVLEKSAAGVMGGNTRLSGGGFSKPQGDDAAAREAYVTDYDETTLGRGNRAIFELMAETSAANLDWLTGHGVSFEEPAPWDPYNVDVAVVSPGWFMGMSGFFTRMRERFDELGIEIAFETKAQALVMDSTGAVAGVRAAVPGGLADYRSGAVVIAAGGYAANTQMLEAYNDPNAGAMMVRGYRGATGDGHRMAEAAGAGLTAMGGMMALHIAAVAPDSTAAGQPASAIPHALSINRDGERFIDESRGYVAHGKAVLDQREGVTTLIIDQAIRDMGPVSGVFATFDRLGLDIVEADTLEELAERVGLPPERMSQTVAAYNDAIENGAAPGVAPPKAQLAHPVSTPPFYALHPLAPGITLTFGGVMTDAEARALEADGRVIPGLYAAGEGAGGAFFEDYIGGGALTMCLTMGRIAGRGAAG